MTEILPSLTSPTADSLVDMEVTIRTVRTEPDSRDPMTCVLPASTSSAALCRWATDNGALAEIAKPQGAIGRPNAGETRTASTRRSPHWSAACTGRNESCRDLRPKPSRTPAPGASLHRSPSAHCPGRPHDGDSPARLYTGSSTGCALPTVCGAVIPGEVLNVRRTCGGSRQRPARRIRRIGGMFRSMLSRNGTRRAARQSSPAAVPVSRLGLVRGRLGNWCREGGWEVVTVNGCRADSARSRPLVCVITEGEHYG